MILLLISVSHANIVHIDDPHFKHEVCMDTNTLYAREAPKYEQCYDNLCYRIVQLEADAINYMYVCY